MKLGHWPLDSLLMKVLVPGFRPNSRSRWFSAWPHLVSVPSVQHSGVSGAVAWRAVVTVGYFCLYSKVDGWDGRELVGFMEQFYQIQGMKLKSSTRRSGLSALCFAFGGFGSSAGSRGVGRQWEFGGCQDGTSIIHFVLILHI